MAKQQSPQELDFNLDYGLGLCLECVATYKMGTRVELPHFACIMAPMAVGGGTAPSCYQHLNVGPRAVPVQPPQMPPPQPMPPTQQEQAVLSEILMPNGAPASVRHRHRA